MNQFGMRKLALAAGFAVMPAEKAQLLMMFKQASQLLIGANVFTALIASGLALLIPGKKVELV